MIETPPIPQEPPAPFSAPDPSAPASGAVTLFDLDAPLESAELVAIPVPFEGTVSGGVGTARGPRALLEASTHLDLADESAGDAWEHGLTMLPESSEIASLSEATRLDAVRLREGLGNGPSKRAVRERIDAAAESVARYVESVSGALLDSSRMPVVCGGEHAVSLGGFRAAAARANGMGILQIDAHADLREAYEGLRGSHASVMRRALEIPGLSRLVQVGLRDVSPEELAQAASAGERVVQFGDRSLARAAHAGEPYRDTVDRIVGELPHEVWVSLDVDGLDPSLCPGTGTPVPGGLGYRELVELLVAIPDSGRKVVGADIVEIGPTSFDGLVAAKALYVLAGAALGTSRR